MKIYVQYQDTSYGCVPDEALEDMVADGSIIAFRRSGEWVEISTGPIRGMGNSEEYTGPEKRGTRKGKSCLTCPDFVDTACRSTSYCPLRTSLQSKSR